MLILSVAMKMAIGRKSELDSNKDGSEVKPRKICYFCLEDPEQILTNRMVNIATSLQLTKEEKELLGENLIAETIDFCLAAKDVSNPDPVLDFFSPGEKVDVIIIDTAILSHSVDENSSTGMKVYIQALKEIAKAMDCVVLILHHTSKYAAANRASGVELGSSQARGSSALVDNSRAMWSLNTMTKKEAEEHNVLDRKEYVQLAQEKGNYSPSMEPLWLKRGKFGVLNQTSLSSPNEGSEKAMFATKKNKRGQGIK